LQEDKEPIPITRSIASDRQASELTSGVNSGLAEKLDACVVGEKMFSTLSKPLLASIFGLPPWPRTFRSAS
jgi:hypothetical protein